MHVLDELSGHLEQFGEEEVRGEADQDDAELVSPATTTVMTCIIHVYKCMYMYTMLIIVLDIHAHVHAYTCLHKLLCVYTCVCCTCTMYVHVCFVCIHACIHSVYP